MKSVVRYSEIGLKSPQSRMSMERILIRNIQACVGDVKVATGLGRIIVQSGDAGSLSRVFGIASVSPAEEVAADLKEIRKAALALYTSGSFRVSCRRITKDTKETSMDIMRDVGAYIQEKTRAKVDLENYDVEIGIEILRKRAYVFNKRIAGPAGLPLGTQGKVAMAFDGSGRAAASAYLMMKRGVEVIPIGKESEAAKIIHERWAYGSSFEVEKGDVMDVANEMGCIGLVLSSEPGLEEIARINRKTGMLVLMPLLGYSEAETKRIARLVTEK